MIDAVIARLAVRPELKLVAGAAEFQAASASNPKAAPAAYVFLLSEVASPNSLGNVGVLQRVQAHIGVSIAVRNVADAQGAASGQDLQAVRQAVKVALLGWPPAAGHEPLERVSSDLLAFRDGYLWWQDVYATAYYDRSET